MKKTNILIIVDNKIIADTLNIYFNCFNNFEVYCFTYDNSDLISNEIYNKTDIFILGIFREYEKGKQRAEGIKVGEQLLKNNKKILLVNHSTYCVNIQNSLYWDIKSEISLLKKVNQILTNNNYTNKTTEFNSIIKKFKQYLTKANSHD